MCTFERREIVFPTDKYLKTGFSKILQKDTVAKKKAVVHSQAGKI